MSLSLHWIINGRLKKSVYSVKDSTMYWLHHVLTLCIGCVLHCFLMTVNQNFWSNTALWKMSVEKCCTLQVKQTWFKTGLSYNIEHATWVLGKGKKKKSLTQRSSFGPSTPSQHDHMHLQKHQPVKITSGQSTVMPKNYMCNVSKGAWQEQSRQTSQKHDRMPPT